MSIAGELETLQENITNAYTALESKGATLPSSRGANQLADTVETIPEGGDPLPEPLDPKKVYKETRPSDWLPMPETVNEHEMYLLLQKKHTAGLTSRRFYISGTTAPTTTQQVLKIEFGTMVDGEFVADDTYTTTFNGSRASSGGFQLPDSIWGNQTSEGMEQLMVKISGTSSYYKLANIDNIPCWFFSSVVEVKMNTPNLTGFAFCAHTDQAPPKIRYASILGLGSYSPHGSGYGIFSSCQELVAVTDLSITEGSSVNFNYFFRTCSSLEAIPPLSSSFNVTQANNMFANCSKIVAVPEINLNGATNADNMFSGCTVLKNITLKNTSSLTSIGTMFYQCRELVTAPEFDTSSVTNMQEMFRGCYSLKTVPKYDTKNVGKMPNMFTGCLNLQTVPLFDTSNCYNMTYMFSESAVKALPAFNTSKVTSFSYFLASTPELSSHPLFDTSSATSLEYAYFRVTLDQAKQYDVSKVTSLPYTFSYQGDIATLPELDTSNLTRFNNILASNTKHLQVLDFRNWDFSKATASNALQNLCPASVFATTVYFNDTFPESGLTFTTGKSIYMLGGNTPRPNTELMLDGTTNWSRRIKLNAERVIPLNGKPATELCYSNTGSDTCAYWYVPDDLLADYQADADWSTLGTQLRSYSDWVTDYGEEGGE